MQRGHKGRGGRGCPQRDVHRKEIGILLELFSMKIKVVMGERHGRRSEAVE